MHRRSKGKPPGQNRHERTSERHDVILFSWVKKKPARDAMHATRCCSLQSCEGESRLGMTSDEARSGAWSGGGGGWGI